MKALVYREYGMPEVFGLEHVDNPAAAVNEVINKVGRDKAQERGD